MRILIVASVRETRTAQVKMQNVNVEWMATSMPISVSRSAHLVKEMKTVTAMRLVVGSVTTAGKASNVRRHKIAQKGA